MILLIDNYDSFSYNLYQLVGEFEPNIRVIRNDEMTAEEIRALQPERIILPGPGRPEDAGITMEVVTALGHEIPILGGLSGAPGHLRRLWRLHYLRQGADAREAVPGPIRSGLPAVPGLSGNSPCGAVPLPGGRHRNPS